MEGETVAAFVAVALDMKQCLRQIVTSHPLRSAWYGFSCVLLRPRLWGAFLEAMRLHAPELAQPTAEILMITTAAEYRGHGHGVRLLSILDEALSSRGVQACLARVREDNPHALAMYKTSGYHEIGSVAFNGNQWKWLVHELADRRK
jgi:ribosomal protein S18 acetylase RimI-like enzyme